MLKRELQDKLADIIVVPRDEADVIRVASAAARYRVPITIRGGGTGNYGRCVPVRGGAVLDMSSLMPSSGRKARACGSVPDARCT